MAAESQNCGLAQRARACMWKSEDYTWESLLTSIRRLSGTELWLPGMGASVITHGTTTLLALLFIFCCGGLYIGTSLSSEIPALIASSEELIQAVLNVWSRCFVLCFVWVQTESHYVGQVDLKIVILLP